MSRPRRRQLTFAVLGLAVLLVFGCSRSTGPPVSAVRITEAREQPPGMLTLVLAGCDTKAVAKLEESDQDVTVTAVGRTSTGDSNACADAIKVKLSRQLGSRTLVDGSDRQLIKVRE